MKPAQPVPERHADYDAHLLRASISGPQQAMVEMQLRENTMQYRNLWLVRFYRRPMVASTSLTTDDFIADAREKLETATAERLRADPSPQCDTDIVKRAPRLLDHLAHTAVQYSINLHTEKMTPEEMKTCLRRDLRAILPERTGVFIAETPMHPLWRYGRDRELEDGTVVRAVQKPPTTFERKLAQYLAGPNSGIAGPEGRIGEILEKAQPFLLTEDTGKIIRYAVDLRRDLKQLLSENVPFDDARQSQLVHMIAEEWFRILPVLVRKQLESSEVESHLSVDALLAKHFPPEVREDKEAFDRKRFRLEQHTITTALDATEDCRDEKIRDLEKIFDVWERVMLRHRLAICDYPTLALALLAGNVRNLPPEAILGQI